MCERETNTCVRGETNTLRVEGLFRGPRVGSFPPVLFVFSSPIPPHLHPRPELRFSLQWYYCISQLSVGLESSSIVVWPWNARWQHKRAFLCLGEPSSITRPVSGWTQHQWHYANESVICSASNSYRGDSDIINSFHINLNYEVF